MTAPSDITAVILAGGFGTRLKGLLGDQHKPMAPVMVVRLWNGSFVGLRPSMYMM
jgi:dTDP-glucose pyrophosphorylase